MGRKKRKVEASDGLAAEEGDDTNGMQLDDQQGNAEPSNTTSHDPSPVLSSTVLSSDDTKKDSSSYAVTSHSADIITEDIYISDGSVDSDEEADDAIQLVLTGSKTGLMRRGLHSLHQHQQPDRVWTRKNQQESETPQELAEEEKRKQEEEELAKLDPAERAARLLQEKQRREAEAKLEARRTENEDNVSKDPLLFSKRTAFDIRFEQIEDKPWQRVEGNTHFTEFFNYDLQEDDWLEYAQQQLAIRQELIDASKQKRAPDPSIVPIQPRKSAVVDTEAVTVVAAPQPNEEASASAPEPNDSSLTAMAPVKQEQKIEDAGLGGAWGAGAAAGTVLAKLIEEQEMKDANADRFHHPQDHRPPPPDDSHLPVPPASSHYGRPLPPPDRGYRGRPPPRGRGGYRGGGGRSSYDSYGDNNWQRPRDDSRGWHR